MSDCIKSGRVKYAMPDWMEEGVLYQDPIYPEAAYRSAHAIEVCGVRFERVDRPGQIDRLMEVNGALCAEVNRQGREIAELRDCRNELREKLSRALGFAHEIMALADLEGGDR